MKIRGLGKRGDEKYYIIISLILGLMVLFIALYFIFQEYFTQDEINWETCRQSIILRSGLPEEDLVIATASAKNFFPLKCKTEVKTIDYQNTTRFQKEFADAMAKCWYLTGEGQLRIFAGESNDLKSRCMVCERIHVSSTNKNQEFYSQNKVDLISALSSLRMDGGLSYWDYLQKGKVAAIPIRKNSNGDADRVIWGDNFKVLFGGHDISWGRAISTFSLSFFYDLALKAGAGSDEGGPGYVFPRNYNPAYGDLFIVATFPVSNAEGAKPSLLYLQQANMSELSKPLAELGNLGGKLSIVPCDSFETVPA